MTLQLWLIRHAPVILDQGICYGASDVPADATLTHAAAQSLAQVLPQRATIKVSALSRTQQLAHAVLALRPDLATPIVDARLNEMNFGEWELQPWDAIPRTAFDAWLADFADERFGGVESTQMVIDRVAAALAQQRAEIQAALQNEPQANSQTASNSGDHPAAVWITHAGVIRAVQYLKEHGGETHPPRRIRNVNEWPITAPDPGQWLVLDV